ncbi:EAL domain-containing protein [Arcobacter sp. FWKO B]|nr:EAL domain-containing protein [Arcobacter sp. FWKO B]
MVQTLKNIVILYVEDEQLLRDIVSKSLSNFTKKQFVAKDGKEGLELFKQYQDEIDLVITDINMPNMNGLEMSRQIKEINQNIPIIVATAFSNTEYLLEAIDLGIDKYVLKPIDMNKLILMMSKSLLYHELQDLYKDDLTKLPNRNKLKKDLEATPQDLLALVNIDKFSTLNDLFGEEIGDKILVEFSHKLKQHFNDNEYKVYRVEADKFVVISKDYDLDTEIFSQICKDFISNIAENDFIIDDNSIDLSMTIGIAKSDKGDAYKHAQRVLYYARETLKSIMIYNDSLKIKQNFEENIKWLKKIKIGLAQNRFKAYFQPIVDTKTKNILKYEALIRYIDDDGSAVAPFKFLHIAKKAKLYPEVIKIMLVEAINAIKDKGIKVSINISFDDMASSESVEFVQKVLEENKTYVDKLSFEILESEKISDFSLVKEFILKVKQYGCRVGIDDFGAGYSNFNILLEIDIDFVKIDGSLIRSIDANSNLQVIVQTIVSFSKKLGFNTVAEFVSDENIYNKVLELGVDSSQGYYLGEPMSFEQVNKDLIV